MSEKLKRNKSYPLADYHPAQGSGRPLASIGHHGNPNIRAIWTGEKRPPKKGEWYLSGAEIEAYQARNDLSTSYHIAKVVRVTKVTTETFEDIEQ